MHLITLRHTTPGRNPLDERSARRRDLYLTKHNTHKPQISMPPEEFEPERIRTRNPNKLRAANVRIRQYGHRDRLTYFWLLFVVTVIQTQLCRTSTFDSYHLISRMILRLRRRKLSSDK